MNAEFRDSLSITLTTCRRVKVVKLDLNFEETQNNVLLLSVIQTSDGKVYFCLPILFYKLTINLFDWHLLLGIAASLVPGMSVMCHVD